MGGGNINVDRTDRYNLCSANRQGAGPPAWLTVPLATVGSRPTSNFSDPSRCVPLIMVGEWVVLIFRVPNYNSADARDGILLPVVIGHYGLRFRL